MAAGPDVTLTRLRDRNGQLVSETVNGRTLTFAYDAAGRRTGRRTPGGAVSEWAYDAAGRRTRLTTSGRSLSFAHDAVGRETARTTGDFASFTSSFDELGRLTSHEVTGRGARLQHRAYHYRPDGGLVGIDDHLAGPRRFDLDRAGRVTAVHADRWTERYAYDEAGNQTDASWPGAGAPTEAAGPRAYTGNRITRAGTVRYEHDAQGRVVLRRKTRLSRKPDTWRYAWDAEDRLTSVTTPDGTEWRYVYDPLGRRVAKHSPTETVHFTWDGATLCEQSTETLTLTWDHAGPRPLTQMEHRRDTDETRFFAVVTDLIGTPTELVDESGTLAWRARTTLWGSTTWTRTATAYTPLRFPGQYFDPESGLHYNYFRYYDPEPGRYLSQDPLGLAPAPNPATYVDNPHTWSDPLGLAPCDEEHLFRGTTRGFDASSGTAASGFTPTSTDPGVAAAFARHSEQFGDAVVHLIPRSALEGIPLERGVIRAEAEVAVGLPAAELARRASVTLPSDVARKMLASMDVHVPNLRSIGDISDALEFDIPKLSRTQIAQFVKEAYRYAGLQ